MMTSVFRVNKDDFSNLPWLMLFCTASSLFPIFFLKLLPEGNVQDLVDQHDREQEEQSDESPAGPLVAEGPEVMEDPQEEDVEL